jgi:adenylate cyclase
MPPISLGAPSQRSPSQPLCTAPNPSSTQPKLALARCHRLLKRLLTLLNRRTSWILALLFLLSVASVLWNMARLSTELIHSQALQNTTLYANTIQEARNLYANHAVARVKAIPGISVSSNYAETPGAIPLPATYLIELGQSLSQNNAGMSVRLFSDYPFPWRQSEGRARDEFERQALQVLRQKPSQPFVQFEKFQGRMSLRYAQADIMKPSCVGCHNQHPDSPKHDWKEGDVRGVLAITQPLDTFIQQTQTGLKSTFVVLGGVLFLALVGTTLALRRLRQTSEELEIRVVERTSQLQSTNQQLQAEQAKSERLLLNILPAPIADKLKEGQCTIADGFAEATILFADLVDFTELSDQMPATQLVGLLNEIFCGFDRLTEHHGLEKIKTIGDAYMVVGGLPKPRADHAEAIAAMALDMQVELDRFNQRTGHSCNIRIGINSGPVIAGVIGTKKFIYDLWGDTVNVASRMESHGLSGTIQVTEATYHRIKHAFILHPRGPIEIKGKGTMTTYLLTEHQPVGQGIGR